MDDQLSEKQRVLDELHVARKFTRAFWPRGYITSALVGVTNAILSGDMTPHDGEQCAAHMLETTVAAGARR